MIDPDLLDRQLAHAIAQRPEGGAVVALSGNAHVAGLLMAVAPVSGTRRGAPARFLGDLPAGILPENAVALLLACATALLPPDGPARVWRRGPGQPQRLSFEGMRPAVLCDLAGVGAAPLHRLARDLARHPMADGPLPAQDASSAHARAEAAAWQAQSRLHAPGLRRLAQMRAHGAFSGPPDIARDQGVCLLSAPGAPGVSRHLLALA